MRSIRLPDGRDVKKRSCQPHGLHFALLREVQYSVSAVFRASADTPDCKYSQKCLVFSDTYGMEHRNNLQGLSQVLVGSALLRSLQNAKDWTSTLMPMSSDRNSKYDL